MPIVHITRRSFLAAMGVGTAGLSLGLFAKPVEALETSAKTVKATFSPSLFVHIDTGGNVTVVCHRSEMGQGVRSTFAYLFGDELGADPARIRLVQADGDKAYGSQNTDGSSSIRKRYGEFRRIAATTRTALIAAAAGKLRVQPKTLSARDHAIHHEATSRKLSFGELAAAAAQAPLPKADQVKLRPDSELRHIGKTQRLLDAPAFVTGKAIYAADVRLPHTLVAVIARPPVVGSEVKRFDAKAALKIPGVKKVVKLPAPSKPWGFQHWGGVAVLADNSWAAMRGQAALVIEWTNAENDSYDSRAYRQKLEQAVARPGEVRRDHGDTEAALKSAKRVVEADYYVPHLPHAPMEPPSATARMVDGQLEIWACTQNPQTAQRAAATAAGLRPEQVLVHVTFLGGAFGRKSKGDFVAEAAYLAKQLDVPVRVQWTRQDDVQHGYYNTVSAQKLTAGLDSSGKVVAWRHRTAFPPIRSTFSADADTPSAGDLQQGVRDLALAVDNVRAEAGAAKARVRIGWLRSVYNIFHAFAAGSFIDEIAHAKKQDPADTWLELIGQPRQLSPADLGINGLSNYGHDLQAHPVDAGRLRHVIERVRKLSDWDAQRKQGRALGLAAHRSFVAYVAVVVSVRERPGKPLHVDEAWVVLDAGRIVNPERARSQMEGSVIFGLNLALFGGVTFAKGRAQQTNFHDMRLLRMNDAPAAIHTELVPHQGRPPTGIGEPGVPPVAPAIANALFALKGKRVRELPLAKAFGYDR